MKTEAEFLQGATKPPASQIKEEYDAAVADCEHEGQCLARYLRIKDGQPSYADGVEVVASEIDRSAARLERVKMDIREYLSAIGDYDSITQMIEISNRHRRALDNIDRDSKNILERSVKARGADPDTAHLSPEVQDSLAKGDRMHQELEPIIADLSERIQKAKKVVGKY